MILKKCLGLNPVLSGTENAEASSLFGSDTAAGQTRIYWGGLRDLLRKHFFAHLRPLTYPASLAAFWAGWYLFLTT